LYISKTISYSYVTSSDL